MAELWKPQSIEVYKSWCETIAEEASDNLTNWENEFVTSILERLHSGRNLTEPQATKLEQLYSKHTK